LRLCFNWLLGWF